MKYETQVAYAALAGSATTVAGSDNEVASFNFDPNYARCVGMKIIPIDMAGVTQFDVALQHAELSQRDAIDYRDFNVSNGSNYVNTFKPVDIGAKGIQVKVRVKNLLQTIAIGQTLRFQIVMLLTNDKTV
jgi:hypothetical protein